MHLPPMTDWHRPSSFHRGTGNLGATHYGRVTYSVGSRFVIEISLKPGRRSFEELFRKRMSQVMIQNSQTWRGSIKAVNR